MESIEQLVHNMKEGQIDALKHVIQLYQQKIFRYVYHITSDFQDSEDITQEVFLKTMHKINDLKNPLAFNSWIFRIAYSQCMQYLRKRKIKSFITLTSFSDLEKIEKISFNQNDEENYVLEDLLTNLKIEDRTLLTLRVLENTSYDELAIILNSKPATLRKRYERLRIRLQKDYIQLKGGLDHE